MQSAGQTTNSAIGRLLQQYNLWLLLEKKKLTPGEVEGWLGICIDRLLLLLLLLSRFSRVQLCATPETAAHQALLSLGFSRQEH